MLLKDYFQIYKNEIDLTLMQNPVECELYSIIAYIIRSGKKGKDISLRDVSTRRRTLLSKPFYRLSGFPDFVVLDRKCIIVNTEDVLGAVEVKYANKRLDKNSAQLQGHIESFNRVLYTNGLEWQFYQDNKMVWSVVLGELNSRKEEIIWHGNNDWLCLLEKLDNIDWGNKGVQ